MNDAVERLLDRMQADVRGLVRLVTLAAYYRAATRETVEHGESAIAREDGRRLDEAMVALRLGSVKDAAP